MNVIGNGRIGSLFHQVFGGKVFRRSDVLVDFEDGPIVIATRNDSLASVIEKIPYDRFKDLVFVQNGMYLEVLGKLGVNDPTLMLIYFAVQRKNDTPVDGGGSLICGKYAQTIQNPLKDKYGISLNEVDKTTFEKQMYSKLLWNTVFGLLCEAHELTVGELVEQKYEDIDALAKELVAIVESVANFKMSSNITKELCDYSKSIPDYIGSVKEWKWRNGWFLSKAVSKKHIELLEKISYERFL